MVVRKVEDFDKVLLRREYNRWKNYKLTEIVDTLNNFAASSDRAWELVYDEKEYISIRSMYDSVHNTLNRLKLTNIRMFIVGTRVYITKID